MKISENYIILFWRYHSFIIYTHTSIHLSVKNCQDMDSVFHVSLYILGHKGPFKWFDYLKQTKAIAAPVKLFDKVSTSPVVL